MRMRMYACVVFVLCGAKYSPYMKNKWNLLKNKKGWKNVLQIKIESSIWCGHSYADGQKKIEWYWNRKPNQFGIKWRVYGHKSEISLKQMDMSNLFNACEQNFFLFFLSVHSSEFRLLDLNDWISSDWDYNVKYINIYIHALRMTWLISIELW